MSQKIKTSVEIDGSLKASQIANATTDTDKFLVSDSGTVKYRTGAEVLSDLGITVNTASKLQHQVKAGVAINKGQAVYVTSADGTNMIVGLASNASEATSSKTMGLLDGTVAINGFANVVTEGLLSGLSITGAVSEGDPVWLGTGGNLIYGLANKPSAPNHLVFIGIVTRVNANNGEIFVKVQNGFELNEIHDVDLKTTLPSGNDILAFEGAPVNLWKNKTIASVLGYTPYNASNPAGYISTYTETDTLASVTARGASTSTLSTFDGGLNIGNAKLRWGGTTSPTLGFPFTGGPNAFWIDVNDGDTGGLAIDNDGTTIYGAGDGGHVFRVIDEDVYQATSNVDASTTFRIQQGQNGGGYVRGNFEITGTLSASGYNKTNWDTAYGWGNHASAGYITQSTGDSRYLMGTTSPANVNNFTISIGNNGSYSYVQSHSSQPLELNPLGNDVRITGNTALHAGNYSSYAVPLSRTITINGTSYDLSANRSWTVTAVEADTLATVVARGDITNGGRPIRLDTNGGGVSIRGSAGGWATGYYFMGGTSNTYRGGFGALGDNDNLTNYWIGPAYNNFYTYIDASQMTHTSSMRAPIFYDSNNTGYYVDPASTSNLNVLSMANKIILGSFPNSTTNNGEAWIGRAADRSAGTMTVQLGGNLDRKFEVVDYGWTTVNFSVNGYGAAEASGSMRAPIFYDANDTSYYLEANGTSRLYQVNAPQGYISNGNPWGTANSAYFPNGITTAGSDNWIYGHTYVGNAPANGAGHEFWGSGKEYHRSNDSTTSHGASGRWLAIQSASGNFIPYSFESEYGNHSWGTVARFRINQSGADRPSIQFSNASNDTRWNIGYCYADDNFRIVQNMGYRNDNSTSDGWGTQRLLLDTAGNFYSDGLYQSNASLRSPIYYDSNNTGYYIDAASTSNLNALTVGGNGVLTYGNAPRAANSYVMFYEGFTLNANDMSTNSTGFTYSNNAPWTGPIARFSTGGGYDLWLNASYGGDGTALSYRTRNGDAGTHNSWHRIYSDSYKPNADKVNGYGGYDHVGTGLRPFYNWGGSNGGASAPSGSSYTTGISVGSHPSDPAYGFQIANNMWNVGLWTRNYNSGFGYWVRLLDSENFSSYNNYGSQGLTAAWFNDSNDTSRYVDPTYTGDSIRVSGDIVAYYSDERLKDRKGNIENALDKVLSLNGFHYTPNARAQELGYKYKEEIGVSAQEVEAILPEIIKDAPIGHGYKTLNYGKLTPLLIEAIKEQQTQIEELKELVNKLINK